MFHRLIRNIDKNFVLFVISLVVIAIGGFLWEDKTYFTWPPDLRPTMNSESSDVFFIVLGVMLLIMSILDKQVRINDKLTLQGITLAVTNFAIVVLMIEQLFQVLFANNLDMIMAVILDVLLFILILRCAYNS